MKQRLVTACVVSLLWLFVFGAFLIPVHAYATREQRLAFRAAWNEHLIIEQRIYICTVFLELPQDCSP